MLLVDCEQYIKHMALELQLFLHYLPQVSAKCLEPTAVCR